MWFNYSQSIINWVYGRLDYICAVAFIADLKLCARQLPHKYHFITLMVYYKSTDLLLICNTSL